MGMERYTFCGIGRSETRFNGPRPESKARRTAADSGRDPVRRDCSAKAASHGSTSTDQNGKRVTSRQQGTGENGPAARVLEEHGRDGNEGQNRELAEVSNPVQAAPG